MSNEIVMKLICFTMMFYVTWSTLSSVLEGYDKKDGAIPAATIGIMMGVAIMLLSL